HAHMLFTRIIPLDRYNWELCLNIRLSPEQEAYIPPVLYSLAQAKFEKLHPFGIEHGSEIVGLIMYGQFGGICWISRIMLDQDHQRKGIGSKALQQLLDQLQLKFTCKEIRTSYTRNNLGAARFFENMGFKEMENALEDEIVAVYQPRM
ncbi:MAG: GNAT family N-acetyltransferase, partial [Bacteroidota bacterium]